MDPVEALERVAYLLDRAREPTYRTRAFLRAAEALRQAGPARVAALAATDRLCDLPHVGPTTAKVASEALAGRVPSYLARLEGDGSLAAGPGAPLRAALRGDCHTHSHWSDGGASIEAMARAAAALGHEYLALTDHSPRLSVANGLSTDRLRRQLDEVARLNEELAPFRVLTGIEVDILEDGRLDQDDEVLAGLDVVVASVHSRLRMDERAMTERMLAAVASPHVDVLGHCTGRLVAGRGRPESRFDADAVFAACAATGTAVEINCRPERLDPPRRLLRLALEAGCSFAIDTDAHAPGQLEWQPYGCDRAAEAGVTVERVINTRGVEHLLAGLGPRRQ